MNYSIYEKTLPDQEIANDLATSSVFFTPQDAPGPTKQPTETSVQNGSPVSGDMQSSHHATTTPHHHATKPSTKHDSKQSDNRSTNPLEVPSTKPQVRDADTTESQLEEVRRVVKQPGREAATYRLTSQEKRTLADLVYTYQRQGYRTSENEVTRIAVNWLIQEYQEEGERSVLARILERLHG